MGKYKNRTGKTRVAAALEAIQRTDILDRVGNAVSEVADGNWFSAVKALIVNDDKIDPKDKEVVLRELELDIVEAQEISKRWSSDMTSDSWLSKNIRPLVLAYLVVCTTVFIVLDGSDVLDIAEHWVSLLITVLMTTIGAYFGSRGLEKYGKIKKGA